MDSLRENSNNLAASLNDLMLLYTLTATNPADPLKIRSLVYPERRLNGENPGRNHADDLRLIHVEYPSHQKQGISNRFPYHAWNVEKHTQEVLKFFDQWIQGESIFASGSPLSFEKIKDSLEKEKIDGFSKIDLLYIALSLHDLGKFFPLINRSKSDERVRNRLNQLRYTHPEHERLSGVIIGHKAFPFETRLRQLGLGNDSIKYVQQMAALHYRLGSLRHDLKSKEVYDFELLGTDKAKQVFQNFLKREVNKKYIREIGIMFLVDSLGKLGLPPRSIVDIFQSPNNINDESLTGYAQSEFGSDAFGKGLKQLPVNMKLGQEILKFIESV